MWRAFLIAGAVCVSGAAVAQDRMADALARLSVFDCSAGGERAVYVFESDELGVVRLLSDQDTPVTQIADGGLSIQTEAGETRISPEGYFLFRDGVEIKGRCASITDAARASVPAVTAGLLPEADPEASASDLAVIMTINDLRAGVAEAEASAADLAAQLAQSNDANAELTATNVALMADLETERAEAATLLTTLVSIEDKLATVMTDRDVAQAEAAKLGGALAVEQSAVTAANTAADELRGMVAETTAKLEATEQDRRATVANVNVLTQEVATVEELLRDSKAETEAALQEAEEVREETQRVRNLGNAAIDWIATQQVRDARAVRAELCRLMQAERPAICG